MDEAALLLKIKESEDAVAGAVVKVTDAVAVAQTAFDAANGNNKQSYGQLLAAKENALAAKENALAANENVLAAHLNSLTHLRHQTFNKQHPSTGTCCLLIKSDGSVLSRDHLGLRAWLISRGHTCLACSHSLHSQCQLSNISCASPRCSTCSSNPDAPCCCTHTSPSLMPHLDTNALL